MSALAHRVDIRQLAPFGREVARESARGHSPNVRLFACRPDPWHCAHAHRACFGAGSVLVLPVDVDPTALSWPRIPNLIADITGLPGPRIRELARALVRDGLQLGYLLDRERPERNLRVIRRAPPK